MPSPPLHDQILRLRTHLVLSTLIMIAALIHGQIDPLTAVTVAFVTAIGAAETACRLTVPALAPKIRATVVVVIVLLITTLLLEGYEPLPVVASVLVSAFSVVEVAARVVLPPHAVPGAAG